MKRWAPFLSLNQLFSTSAAHSEDAKIVKTHNQFFDKWQGIPHCWPWACIPCRAYEYLALPQIPLVHLQTIDSTPVRCSTVIDNSHPKSSSLALHSSAVDAARQATSSVSSSWGRRCWTCPEQTILFSSLICLDHKAHSIIVFFRQVEMSLVLCISFSSCENFESQHEFYVNRAAGGVFKESGMQRAPLMRHSSEDILPDVPSSATHAQAEASHYS